MFCVLNRLCLPVKGEQRCRQAVITFASAVIEIFEHPCQVRDALILLHDERVKSVLVNISLIGQNFCVRNEGIEFACFLGKFHAGIVSAFGADFQFFLLRTAGNEPARRMQKLETVPAATGAARCTVGVISWA